MKLGDRVFKEELDSLETRIIENGLDNFVFRFKNLLDDYQSMISDTLMDYAKIKFNSYNAALLARSHQDFSGEEEPKVREKRYDHAGEYHHGYLQK